MGKRKTYGSGRYGGYGRKQSSGGLPVVRVTLFAALICLACVLRFSTSGPLVGLREQMNTVLRTDTDYKGAVAVLGRAIAGESEEDGNAIVVFGRMVLGLEEDEADAYEPPSQASREDRQQEPRETEPGETEPGETGPEDDDKTPTIYEREPAGVLSSGLTLWDQPGLSDRGGETATDAGEEGYPTVAEAVLPVFQVSHTLSYAMVGEEEDTTPNEEFVIPSPDSIDDTVYTLPFSYVAPVTAPVTSYFGYRIHPISGNTTFHHGADLGVGTGTKVKAFADGTVSEVGYSNVYGNYLKIQHADGFLSMYAHLDKVSVKEGKSVKMGDKVAESGNTGNSTGPHLHFEIRRNGKILNPFNYVSFT